VYGCNAEGIMSAPALMASVPALCDVRIVRCAGSSAVVTAVVSSNKKLRKSCKRLLKDWCHSVDIHDFPVAIARANSPALKKRTRDGAYARDDVLNAALMSKANVASFKWIIAPGLFAGGVVDVMTLAMLRCMERPLEGSRNLDYACGSGIIAKWLLLAQPNCSVVMCDNDTVALEVAKLNNPAAEAVLSDSWDCSSDPSALQEAHSFDNIYSNPPLHRGSLCGSFLIHFTPLLIICRPTRRLCRAA
jgi:16S rRNA G1207 methylase RsmC